MDIASLNKKQQEAVLATEGPVLIFAGAGCGKTKTLTHRIAYMIQKLKVDPTNILAVSFTNKAANEMKERVQQLLYNKRLNGISISTFHSLCVKILRKNIHKLGFKNNFLIYSTSDQLSLLKQKINDNYTDDIGYKPYDILSFISSLKSKMILPEDCNLEHIVKDIYHYYQIALKSFNSIDFDDIILFTVQLLKKDTEILKFYQNKFKYIMVDEYQDTNFIQFELLKMLAPPQNNICVVGDDDQSIYGWRGADITKILNFEKDFNSPKIIKLEQNYRSKNNILKIANAVISNNKNRKDKALWSALGEGKKITYFKARDEIDEAEYISGKIKELTQLYNYKYNDIAILYRTNHQSKMFEISLASLNIPFKVIGGSTFYDRKEVKDIIAYLKVLYNKYDEISLLRILNYPKRGIGHTTVIKLNEYSIKNKISFNKLINNIDNINIISNYSKESIKLFLILMNELDEYFKCHSLFDSINFLIDRIGLENEIFKDEKDNFKAVKKMDNIREMLQFIKHLEESYSDFTLKDLLEKISLSEDKDENNKDKKKEDNNSNVTLMTLHSAKGLEYKIVFLAGLEDDIIPHQKSMLENFTEDEERRLFYVGLTRAQNHLFLTNSDSRKKYGKKYKKIESRFLKEIPVEYLTIIKGIHDEPENNDDDDIAVDNLLSKLKSKLAKKRKK